MCSLNIECVLLLKKATESAYSKCHLTHSLVPRSTPVLHAQVYALPTCILFKDGKPLERASSSSRMCSVAAECVLFRMCSVTAECVLLLQNVFCLECVSVLLLQNVFCLECALLLQNVFWLERVLLLCNVFCYYRMRPRTTASISRRESRSHVRVLSRVHARARYAYIPACAPTCAWGVHATKAVAYCSRVTTRR